jgi:hypothetical protein
VVVLARYVESELVTGRHEDVGRLKVDIKLDGLTGLQRTFLIMRMPRPIR